MHQVPAEILMGDLWGMQQPLKVMITIFAKITAEAEEEKANNRKTPCMSSLGPAIRKLQNTTNGLIENRNSGGLCVTPWKKGSWLEGATDGLRRGEYPRERSPKLRNFVGENVGEVCDGTERN
jgi:hypothetical protein